MSENHKIKITSRDNPRVKHARQVRDGKIKDQIFIEGWRLCQEALRADLKISEVFLTEKFTENARHEDFIKKVSSFDSFEVSEKIFDSLSDTKTSQGIIFIAEKPFGGKSEIEANLSKSDFPLIVLLHQINNPTNLGAILRTAEAAGVSGIIISANSADVFAAKSLRGAMGAAFRLSIWTNADYYEVLNWAQKHKLKSVCADVHSTTSYTEINWKIARLLIVGSEGHGLSEAEKKAADEGLIIPMENGVESLNLAVACGVVLFEAKRQKAI